MVVTAALYYHETNSQHGEEGEEPPRNMDPRGFLSRTLAKNSSIAYSSTRRPGKVLENE